MSIFRLILSLNVATTAAFLGVRPPLHAPRVKPLAASPLDAAAALVPDAAASAAGAAASAASALVPEAAQEAAAAAAAAMGAAAPQGAVFWELAAAFVAGGLFFTAVRIPSATRAEGRA